MTLMEDPKGLPIWLSPFDFETVKWLVLVGSDCRKGKMEETVQQDDGADQPVNAGGLVWTDYRVSLTCNTDISIDPDGLWNEMK